MSVGADLMPGESYVIPTRAEADRIARAVVAFEGQPPNRTVKTARTPAFPWPILGKITSGNTSKGDTNVTVRIYNGTAGSESDSGQDITNVVNKFGSVSNGKFVWCQTNGINWYLTSAEC